MSEQLNNVVEKVKQFYKEHQTACIAGGSVVGGVVALKTIGLLYRVAHRRQVNATFRALEEDIVHLYIHPRWSHGPNFFPHCVKVETFLRLAKIPYVVHFTNEVSLSPNGRLPFIVHNGTVLSDGEFIIQYLTEQFNVSMDDRLTSQEHAKGLMVRRMVETSINYGLNRTTFVDYPKYMSDMFSKEYLLEPVMAGLLVRGMRKATIRVLNAVGYGDLSQEQYEVEFLRDMQSLEAFLSAGPFLFGNVPSTYDCSVYAWLQVAGEMGPNGAALSYLTSSKTLRDYINRVTKLAFPDIDDLQAPFETQRFIPA
ncbi:hypothetical protein AGDE_01820 [Angomonas deanei]|uniref:Glutathione S-transferase, N-terminal domain/Glutathione S-transferase N-terminal domain/Outer mitochondrial membrane transport complex protein, putative n=1 Tax=Angomonas deanei TaxID=59799 RepID=S9VMQ2_9TRYP|nr:hypothetical protein AGDE_05174 [Angomonas deanei]EPY42103.1 hypothetical protein AGDE_01820 [Angomonas deanei]CAD2219807.1 Glutathione S-transferase, N-terminal domain/Glutathione S-transferase N-terminal domain/Outer mitochondrial membrane transport complex protein, putative [Angomonas deanei]|eukprot:EPY38755.1 hypothetical protein AGDE_05174 [Angomonas deanei]